MPSRETEELRAMDLDELESRLAESKQELFNLRFQLATGQLDNNARIGQLRKQVARIHTVIREQELEAFRSLEVAAGGDGPQGSDDG